MWALLNHPTYTNYKRNVGRGLLGALGSLSRAPESYSRAPGQESGSPSCFCLESLNGYLPISDGWKPLGIVLSWL